MRDTILRGGEDAENVRFIKIPKDEEEIHIKKLNPGEFVKTDGGVRMIGLDEDTHEKVYVPFSSLEPQTICDNL